MKERTPAGTLTILVTVLVLAAPALALTPPPDGVAATLEGYTAVNTGLPTSGEFLFCTVGDINGDGYDDIAASAQNNSQQSTVLGLRVYTCKGGTGWEDNSSGLPTVDRYGGIGLGDVDGDGDLDLVSGVEIQEGGTTKGVKLWLNNGTSGGKLSWAEGPTPETSWEYSMVVLADVNDDDDLDIVAATENRGVRVWTGNGGAGGTLTWTAASTGLPTSGMYTGITVADMNKDGDADIVACDYSGGIEVHLWTGNGAGTWTSRDSSFPTGSEATMGVAVGDVDDDGNMDIVYGRRNNAIKCLLGNSGGTSGTSFNWTYANTGLSTVSRYSQVALADVDIDGDLDLLAASAGRGLELYLGNGGAGGSMSWSLSDVGLPSSDHYYGAAFGDFNKDRVLDAFGSLYQRRGVGGLAAFRGAVTGASFPTARAVWNGTEANVTSVVLGGTVTLDGRLSFDAEDAPDGDTTGLNLTYEWNLTTAPAGSSQTDASLTPSDDVAVPDFVPDAIGNYTFTISVVDTDGHWSIDEAYLGLEVLKPNDAPVAVAGEDQTVETGDVVELNGTGSYDPDGTLVDWEWNASAANPVNVTLSATNVSAVGFTAPNSTGVYAFTLRVLDDNGTWSAPDEVNVTVELPPNVLPVAVLTAGPAITLGDTVHLNGTASYDPDGEIDSWEWNCTSHPSLGFVESDSILADATPGEVGTYDFTLRVLDDRGDWSPLATVSVVVLAPDVNLPPVAVITGPSSDTMVVNSTLRINGTESYDADGSLEEYLWNVTYDNWTTFTSRYGVSIELTASDEGTIIVTLAVMDNNGSWSIEEATLTITVLYPPPPPPPPPNERPLAVIDGPSEEVLVGETVALDASSSHDPDGEVVDYEWACPSHPSLPLGGLNTTLLTFVGTEETVYTLSLRVIDDNGSWSDAVTYDVVTVLPPPPPNGPPVVRVIGPEGGLIELEDGVNLTIEWEASDPEDDELFFGIGVTNNGTLVSIIDGLSNDTRSYTFTIAFPEELSLDLLVVKVTATEALTQDALEANDTSPVFYFQVRAHEPEPEPEPEPEVEREYAIPWILLVILVAVIVVVVVVVMVVMDRGRMGLAPPSQATSPPPSSCPGCGGPVTTDNAFGQPYCAECDRFL